MVLDIVLLIILILFNITIFVIFCRSFNVIHKAIMYNHEVIYEKLKRLENNDVATRQMMAQKLNKINSKINTKEDE